MSGAVIEVQTSRSGHPVLVQDGKYLGSSFDPTRDALRWAQKAADRLRHYPSAVVLGLGSGYHASELLKIVKNKNIIFVEKEQVVVDTLARLSPEFIFDQVVQEPDWAKLIDHKEVRSILSSEFCILKYGPSCQMNPQYYTKVEQFLVAREKSAFLLHLRMRPELFSLLDSTRLDKLEGELISIKTMQKVFTPGPFNDERRIWKILEELVI